MSFGTEEELNIVASSSGRLVATSAYCLMADRHIKFPKLAIGNNKIWGFKSQSLLFSEGCSKPINRAFGGGGVDTPLWILNP